MLFPADLRSALPDFYRNGPCLHFGSLEAQESHRGFPAVRVALVEYEITEAVEYGSGIDVFQGLHDVWMVSYDGICTGLYQQVGIVTLLHVGNGLELRTPMQYGHDTGRGVRGFIFPDSSGQPLDGSTAYIWFSFRSRPVLYREGDGVEECHFELAFPYGYGSGLFFNRLSVTEWDNVSVPECVISIGQSIPPMVYGVVIG